MIFDEINRVCLKNSFSYSISPGNFLCLPEISVLSHRQFLHETKCGNFNLQALRGGALHYTNMPMNGMCSKF